MTDPSTPFEPSDELIECLAQDIHRAYLAERAADGTPADHPALQPWEALPDGLKGQNRRQARENLVRLGPLGLRLVPLEEAGDRRVTSLTAEQIEAQAREEHDSWCRQKRVQGYRYGSPRCDEAPNLLHPDLLAWEELEESVREKDREPVRRMLDSLAACGYAAVPAD